MKFLFEKNKRYIVTRNILLLFCIFCLLFILKIIFKHNEFININLMMFFLLVFLTYIFSIFLLIDRLKIISNYIIFYNVFNYELKRIELKLIKGKKIIFSNPPYNFSLFYLLYGKSNQNLIYVKLDLSNKKKYNFNGSILTRKSLEELSKKI
mgnify:CR=1 FL=1